MKKNYLSNTISSAGRSLVSWAGRLRNIRVGLYALAMSLATLTHVFGQPVITNQPQNQTAIAGTTVTFTVGATGAPPLSYQWRSYATPTTFTNIPFGTEATLVLTNVQYPTRRFSVVVTDAGRLSVISSPLVFLTWLLAITAQPADQMVDVCATATFVVTATGTAPRVYQWRFNDGDLAGQTNASLVLTNVQLTNACHYAAVLTTAFGSVTSRLALLTFPTFHRIGGITANPDYTVSLSLVGVVPRLFAPYYDLYPLETSTNLRDWTPLVTLLRTNDSAEALSYLDQGATNYGQRFYRTPTNFLVTPFPKPSGPYPVGAVTRLLTDPSRIRNTSPPTNAFMVTFWYPAEARVGVLPGAYVEKEITMISYPNGAPSYWNSPATVARFVSHALPGIPPATNRISYPVVIFSHGWVPPRTQNTDVLVELASHGYVVVALDHKDTFASVFPGGQVVRGAPVSQCQDFNSSISDYRTHELVFVIDELSRLNTNDVLLAGRLDLENLGLIGTSFGGMTVAEVGRIDGRCKAVVLLDAGITLEIPPDLLRLGLPKPFLSMSSTMDRPCVGFGDWLFSSLSLFTNATSNAYWCQIQDSTHQSFLDKGSLINDPTLTGNPTTASRGISQAIRGCTRSFFDKYLKNQDDHFLDNPAAVHPNIINFRRKCVHTSRRRSARDRPARKARGARMEMPNGFSKMVKSRSLATTRSHGPPRAASMNLSSLRSRPTDCCSITGDTQMATVWKVSATMSALVSAVRAPLTATRSERIHQRLVRSGPAGEFRVPPPARLGGFVAPVNAGNHDARVDDAHSHRRTSLSASWTRLDRNDEQSAVFQVEGVAGSALGQSVVLAPVQGHERLPLAADRECCGFHAK